MVWWLRMPLLALLFPCTLGLQSGLPALRSSCARSRPVLLVVDTGRLIEENERLIRHATRLKGVGETAEGIKGRLQEARAQEAKLEARLQEVTLARRALEEEALEEEVGAEGHEVPTAARRSAPEPEPHRAQASVRIAHRQPAVAASSWFDAGRRLTPEPVEPVVVVEPEVVEPEVVEPEAVEPVVPAVEAVVEAVEPASSCYDAAGLKRLHRQRVAHYRLPLRRITATSEATTATIEAATEAAEPAEESEESWISCGRDASGVRLAPPQAPATETAPEARDLLSPPPPPPSPPPPPPPKWQHVQADKHGFHHW